MKKLLLSTILVLLTAMAFAQYPTPVLIFDDNDTVPNDSVIITEVLLPTWNYWGYLELTNLSSDTVEMSNFFMLGRYSGRTNEPIQGNDNKVNLRGTVLPGQSYLIVYVDRQPTIFDEAGDLLYEDGYRLNREIFEMADTFFTYGSQLGGGQFVLLSRYQVLDSVGNVSRVDSAATDVFNSVFQNDGGRSNKVIAGLGPGLPTYTLWHRKTNFKRGNTNWEQSSSDDISTSEWIYTTHNLLRGYRDFPFTTVKSHFKNETLDVTSNGRAQIDEANLKITFPYGVRRDSVFRQEFNFGPNIAWDLKIGPDTSQFYLQTNDTIIFMLPGDSVLNYKFHVEVEPPLNSFNNVRPLLYKNINNRYEYRYSYSYGNEPFDTIGNLPYDLRIDTLMSYVVVEEGATADIIYASGVESPDIKYGDTLVVTAASGDVKKYKLSVNDYVEDFRSELSTVILPGLDIWENPETFFYTDTFLNFSSLSYSYSITLPEGTEVSPAIIGVPVDPNAVVNVKRAKNLFGSSIDRTATIQVLSENRKDTSVYKIEFSVEKPTPELDYSPFFSDLGTDWAITNNYAVQIFNPMDEVIDLSDYVILQLRNNNEIPSLESFKELDRSVINRFSMRPGSIVMNDEGGRPLYYPDFVQKTVYLPAKSVYSMVNYRSYPMEPFAENTFELASKVDFIIYQNFNQPTIFTRPAWDQPKTSNAINQWIGATNGFDTLTWANQGLLGKFVATSFNDRGSVLLLKILSDSVKDGTKAMNDFVNDYEVVDVVNGVNTVGEDWMFWNKIDGQDTIYRSPGSHKWNIYRKPTVYKGNPIDRMSFGIGTDSTVIAESEWEIYGYAGPGIRPENDPTGKAKPEILEISRMRFENHVMDYKEHIASVSSVVYLVTPGIEGEQDIYGLTSGVTVQDFINNLILADPGVKVYVKNSDVVKAPGETLVETDQLFSYSTRGIDSVVYNLNFGSLNDDIALTSASYNIEIATDKKTGTITGIPYGATILEALSNVSKPELAKLAVTDGGETMIPTIMYNKDTVMVQSEQYNEVVIGDHVYFEVTAQNGDVCLYDLVWETAEDPFVISNVYVVNQDRKEINFIDPISIRVFLDNLIPAAGCNMIVKNKAFLDREKGDLKYDDRLVVSNGTKSVTYFLKFNEGGSYVSVDKVKPATEVNAYPNPSKGLYYFGNVNGAKQMKVYNITGALIKVVEVVSDQAILDITNEARGVYFVKFEGEVPSVVKIVKE